MHRNLCAACKRNGASSFGAGLGGIGFSGGDGTAKTELPYSTTRGISRAGPRFGRLIVCIIQVPYTDLSLDSERLISMACRGSISRSERGVAPPPARRCTKLVLLVGVLVALSGTKAHAQTPSVSITNTTRGGNTAFYVGDAWTISITGGAANAQVEICIPGSCSSEGYSDGNGNFSLGGYMASGDVGTWNETWSVGGVTAAPDPLTFYIYPSSAATCDLTTSSPTAIYSEDYLDIYANIWYQALGSTYVSGVLDPAGYCVMYSDSWSFGPSMSGARTISQPYVDQ